MKRATGLWGALLRARRFLVLALRASTTLRILALVLWALVACVSLLPKGQLLVLLLTIAGQDGGGVNGNERVDGCILAHFSGKGALLSNRTVHSTTVTTSLTNKSAGQRNLRACISRRVRGTGKHRGSQCRLSC